MTPETRTDPFTQTHGPIQVRKAQSKYRHFVPGGRDAAGMLWTYQRAYCGASAGEYGWQAPDAYGWNPNELPECPKCLARMEKGRR